MDNITITANGTESLVALWSDVYGYVTATGDQWIGKDMGQDVRYGSFRTNYMAQYVNLRLDEVYVEHYPNPNRVEYLR